MMISRKRRNSPTPTSSEIPSKRARVLSNLWQSEEDITVDRVFKSGNHQRTRRTRVIGESSGEFSIDREDDRITGRRQKSGRRLTNTITDSEIGVWKKEKASANRNPSRRLLRKQCKNDSGRLSQDAPACKSIGTKSGAGINNSSSGLKAQILNSKSFVSTPSNRDIPNLVVQISQHSSFDPEQYILYKSSLSTQGTSLTPHQGSAPDESLISANICIQDRNRIIPDSQSLASSSSHIPPSSTAGNVSSLNSQSLPGSSSYIPSSGTGGNVSSLYQSAQVNRDIGTLENTQTSNLNTTSQSEHIQSIEGSSSSSISPNQDFVAHLDRPASAPSQSVASNNTSTRFAGFTRISRSQSDTGFISSSGLRQTSSHRISSDLSRREKPSSILQESSLEVRGSHPIQLFHSGNPEPEPDFQTQAPLSLGSQATQTSADLLEENWQSGQIVPKTIESASQVSSTSPVEASTRSIDLGAYLLEDLGEGVPPQSSLRPQHVIVPEDSVGNYPTLATAASTLSSQTNRPHHSAEIQDVTSISTDSLKTKIKKAPESFLVGDSSLQVSLPSPNFMMSDRDSRTGFYAEKTPQNTTTGIPPGRPSANPGMPERIPPRAGFFLVNSNKTNLMGASTYSASFAEPTSSDRDLARANRLPSTRPGGSTPSASGVPAQTLRERLKEMRSRRSSLDQKESRRDTKSPSLIPEKVDAHVQQEQSQLEVRPLKVPVDLPLPTLPMRAVQPPPHTPTFPSKLSSHSEVAYPQKSATMLIPTHLKEMEFVVPLSMSPRVRDQYVSTINYYQKDIETFMKVKTPSDEVVGKVRVMLDRVKQVTTHVDLDGGGGVSQGTPGREEAVDEAVWAETCSAKFLFLRRFLNSLRLHDVHVAIVARPGQLHDIIETFLIGTETKYNRPATVSRSEPGIKDRMDVTLIASGGEGASALPKPADIVIAFDSSFNPQDVQVGILRGHLVNVGQLSPVIHLLVYKSAEHIERCIPESMNPIERLRRIVSCVIQARHDVGHLLPDEAGTAAVAEEVAAFVEAGGQETNWTFPSIRPIDDVEGVDSRDLESLNQSGQLATEQNMYAQTMAVKRAFDNAEYNSLPLKRQRSTPVGDTTHVSDSVNQDSQSTEAMAAARAREVELRTVRADRNAFEEERDVLKNENSVLKNDMLFIKSEVEYLRTKDQSTRASLAEAEQRCKDLDQSLNELQYRYEDKHKTVHEQRVTLRTLTKAAEAGLKKESIHAIDISKLTNSRAKLEQELESTRAALRSSNVPGVAEFEALNAEIRNLRSANLVLTNRNTSNDQDMGYLRQQYQTASNAAAEATNQISTLQSKLEVAERKAQGEATRLAEAHRNLESHKLLSRIEQLELELVSRERLLQKQAEDLRGFQQRGRTGGVVTRGSSVQAKSPRGGSRGGSPGAGTGASAGTGYGSKVGGSGLRYGSGVGGEGR